MSPRAWRSSAIVSLPAPARRHPRLATCRTRLQSAAAAAAAPAAVCFLRVACAYHQQCFVPRSWRRHQQSRGVQPRWSSWVRLLPTLTSALSAATTSACDGCAPVGRKRRKVTHRTIAGCIARAQRHQLRDHAHALCPTSEGSRDQCCFTPYTPVDRSTRLHQPLHKASRPARSMVNCVVDSTPRGMTRRQREGAVGEQQLNHPQRCLLVGQVYVWVTREVQCGRPIVVDKRQQLDTHGRRGAHAARISALRATSCRSTARMSSVVPPVPRTPRVR